MHERVDLAVGAWANRAQSMELLSWTKMKTTGWTAEYDNANNNGFCPCGLFKQQQWDRTKRNKHMWYSGLATFALSVAVRCITFGWTSPLFKSDVRYM